MLPEPNNNAVCISCTARCCQQYRVQISGADVYRLVKGLKLHPGDFVMVTPTIKKKETADSVYFNATSDPFELCLEKHPKRRDETGSRHCTFLMVLDRDHQRCGVYPHRPMVCRLFPTYNRDGGVGVNNSSACPPRAWSIDRLDIPTVELLQNLWYVEVSTYRGILERWNREARKLEGDSHFRVHFFLEWLVSVYGRLEPLFAPHLATREGQIDFVARWARAQQIETYPFDAIGTEKEEAALEAFGDGGELLSQIHALLEEMSRLQSRA